MLKKRSITKSDLAQAVYYKLGYSKKFSKDFVNAFFNTLINMLQQGQGFKIHHFGKFILKDKKKRLGRNPQTGKELMISERRVVLFYASPFLKNNFKTY